MILSLSPRTCLGLFGAPSPPAIQQESDLISSLFLLEEFGVTMLPVLVRLSENRLDIVRKALAASPTAYRKYDKVSLSMSYIAMARIVNYDMGVMGK